MSVYNVLHISFDEKIKNFKRKNKKIIFWYANQILTLIVFYFERLVHPKLWHQFNWGFNKLLEVLLVNQNLMFLSRISTLLKLYFFLLVDLNQHQHILILNSGSYINLIENIYTLISLAKNIFRKIKKSIWAFL